MFVLIILFYGVRKIFFFFFIRFEGRFIYKVFFNKIIDSLFFYLIKVKCNLIFKRKFKRDLRFCSVIVKSYLIFFVLI